MTTQRAHLQVTRMVAQKTHGSVAILIRNILRTIDGVRIVRLMRTLHQGPKALTLSPRTERAIRLAALIVLRRNRITPRTGPLRLLAMQRMQRRLLHRLNRRAPQLNQRGVIQDWQTSELLMKISNLERELERLERAELEKQDPRSERTSGRRARSKVKLPVHRLRKRVRLPRAAKSVITTTSVKQGTKPSVLSGPTATPTQRTVTINSPQLPSRSLDLFLHKTEDGWGNEYTASVANPCAICGAERNAEETCLYCIQKEKVI